MALMVETSVGWTVLSFWKLFEEVGKGWVNPKPVTSISWVSEPGLRAYPKLLFVCQFFHEKHCLFVFKKIGRIRVLFLFTTLFVKFKQADIYWFQNEKLKLLVIENMLFQVEFLEH
jgi:hypothetical protein